MNWLKNKFTNSKDPEEKAALKYLYKMIIDIKKKADLLTAQAEREERQKEEEKRRRENDAEARDKGGGERRLIGFGGTKESYQG